MSWALFDMSIWICAFWNSAFLFQCKPTGTPPNYGMTMEQSRLNNLSPLRSSGFTHPNWCEVDFVHPHCITNTKEIIDSEKDRAPQEKRVQADKAHMSQEYNFFCMTDYLSEATVPISMARLRCSAQPLFDQCFSQITYRCNNAAAGWAYSWLQSGFLVAMVQGEVREIVDAATKKEQPRETSYDIVEPLV